MLGFLYLQTTAQHDLTGSANPWGALEWGCMWVQGWTTHSRHNTAIPVALFLLSVEPFESHSLFCQWIVSVFYAFQCSNNPFTFPDRWRRRPRRRQQQRPLQIFWHMCSLDLVEEVASFHTLQERPLAQSQRWKISKPWAPFFLCLVHTSPCLSTGLQILVQKWRAQQ